MTIQKPVLFLLALQLVMKAAVLVNCDSCPDGWSRYEQSCYYIADTTTKRWVDSWVECLILEPPGSLAIISSAEENQFIGNLTKNRLTDSTVRTWIGLWRNGQDSKFYWVDHTPLEGNYSNWASGEPNNVKDNEDCVFMKKGGEWNDDPCNLNGYSFWENKNLLTLCERPI